MTIGATHGVSLIGLSGTLVQIEVDISDGLPHYSLLGLPDLALMESRDRVRSALVNSRELWPNKKVTVSLSPAWLPKSGSNFDLPIAVAILAAQEVIPIERVIGSVFFGELALDGRIREARGVLPALISLLGSEIERVIVPMANAAEAKLVSGLEIIPMENISELLKWLRTGTRVEVNELFPPLAERNFKDLSDVAGQLEARYALEVAATGGHHILMIGPPGTGKTMLAERLPSLLPELGEKDSLEVSAIHSVAGVLKERGLFSKEPPFIAPHHTTTRTAMVGGGSSVLKPGACSLAHNGVLFIDEAPECVSGVLDALRQPLESGQITITRAIGSATFPANFILVLAANPCPCGRLSGRGRGCTCSSLQIRRYLNRLSGPLIDRVDLRIKVEPPTRTAFASGEGGESSALVRERVATARLRSVRRFKSLKISRNAEIPAFALRNEFKAERRGMSLLHSEMDRENLTARGFHKVLRLSWSIADLAEHDLPLLEDVQRALSLRDGMDLFG